MNQWEAMEQRHSVRAYEPRPIDTKAREQLEALIAQCNAESGLHMQLITDEPLAFTGMKAHYGTFSGVRHYIAVVGQKGKEVSEICGYYGEKVVLFAQQLGLNTCWVGLTYNRKKAAVSILDGEKLYLVIAVGYGKTQGVAHRSKTKEAVTQTDGAVPAWFDKGVEAALLAPTAMNQQKFTFIYSHGQVHAKAGVGFYSHVDLGIAKYHFEIGSGVSCLHP